MKGAANPGPGSSRWGRRAEKGSAQGRSGSALLAQHGAQQVVEPLDQRPVGPVGGRQLVGLASLALDAVPFLAEYGHVGAPKAVDRLFGVADEKELALIRR